MSLLEINLEKPALVEERVYPDAESAPTDAAVRSGDSGESDASGGTSLLKPALGLLVLAGLVLFARKRRSTTDEEPDEAEAETETEAEPAETEADESGPILGRGRNAMRAVGILGSFLGAVLVARKVLGGRTGE